MQVGIKSTVLRLAALALIMLWALPCRTQAAALGKAVQVVGNVKIKRGTQTRDLLARDEFQAGDVLRVLSRSAVTLVYYANGARCALAAQSVCRIEPKGPQPLSGLAPRPLPAVNVALVRATSGALSRFAGTVIRGGQEEGAPCHLAPIGAARDPMVILQWKSPVSGQAVGETRWQVRLRASDGAKTLWARTLDAGVTTCALPDGLLHPGVRYEWTVCAVGGSHNGASSQAPLYALTPGEQERLRLIERSAAGQQRAGPTDRDADRLLAEVYERMALYQDALRVWTGAAKACPADKDAQRSIARLRALLQM